jgi:cytochrome P450
MELTIAPVFLPGPRPDPLLGWRGALLPLSTDPLAALLDLHATYGNLVALSRSAPVIMFAFGAEHNRRLLSDSSLFHNNIGFGLPMPEHSAAARVSYGLLAMNGDRHRQHRRLMLPAFHRQQVASYHALMVATIEQHVAAWQPGTIRDIAQAMQELTLAIAMRTLFSLDAGPTAQTLGKLFTASLNVEISPLESLLPAAILGPGMHQLNQIAIQIEQQVQALIAERRASTIERTDVLAMLIAARDEDGQALTDTELVGQTYTLFAAGHETSANALAWALLLLQQHPQIHAALYTELVTALAGAAPSLEQLAHLPLLDQVVKEVLRLMPPASLLLRMSTAPCTLGGYELPAESAIFLSPLITHRDPAIFPQPNAFQPERWAQSDPSIYAYLPFGAGPRMCIGTSFALMEIKLALALIVQRFRLELPPYTRVDPELRLTLRPRNGLPMRIHAQDNTFSTTPIQGGIHRLIDLPQLV